MNKEIMKELYAQHKLFLQYQKQLKDNNKFFCINCGEILPLSERDKVKNLCHDCYREITKINVRKSRERKKNRTL